jgi:hypothetical protein
MRIRLSSASRVFFLLISILSCAGAVNARPANSALRSIWERKENNQVAAQQSLAPATTSPDFAMQVSPTSFAITIQSPQGFPIGQADGTLTLTGVNGFQGTVDLSCSIAGAISLSEPTCNFPDINPINQITVSASGPAATTTLGANSTPVTCEPPDECFLFVPFGGIGGTFAAL